MQSPWQVSPSECDAPLTRERSEQKSEISGQSRHVAGITGLLRLLRQRSFHAPHHSLAAARLVLVSAPSEPSKPPIFAGIWSGKDPGGVGGLLYDLTWDGLVSRWKELGAANQYLADVEA